jgi:hypothetical protein
VRRDSIRRTHPGTGQVLTPNQADNTADIAWARWYHCAQRHRRARPSPTSGYPPAHVFSVDQPVQKPMPMSGQDLRRSGHGSSLSESARGRHNGRRTGWSVWRWWRGGGLVLPQRYGAPCRRRNNAGDDAAAQMPASQSVKHRHDERVERAVAPSRFAGRSPSSMKCETPSAAWSGPARRLREMIRRGLLRSSIEGQAGLTGEARCSASSVVAAPVGLRWIPVPRRRDRGGDSLVPALRAVLPRNFSPNAGSRSTTSLSPGGCNGSPRC